MKYNIPMRGYAFHYVDEQKALNQVSRFVAEKYQWRGYSVSPADQIAERKEGQHTLAAYNGRKIVGTVTIRTSNLNLSHDYPDVSTRRAVEYGQLAADTTENALEILGPLLHLSLDIAKNAKHAMIEVNPRHVTFYRRVFGFEIAAEPRTCTRVDAPGYLMKLDIKEARKKIVELGGLRAGRSSVYHYCLSAKEADIAGRDAREWLYNF